MSAIWQTVVGRDDPVDGKPNQFLAVEHLFGSIEESMKELDQSFDSIRSGTSADFRGAAADAFGDKLGSISTAVGTVPIIAGQLEQTFRNHRLELERLQAEVNKAVAQAECNWNEKRASDANQSEAHQRLGFVDRQIAWLESQGDGIDDGDKAYWTSERIEAQTWSSSADRRRNRAADAIEASKADWHRLDRAEDELDSRTAKALDGIVLWTLADPSMLQQMGRAFGDLFEALADYGGYLFSGDFLLDICEVLYNLVGLLADVAGILSLAAYTLAAVFALTGVGAPIAAALLAIGANLHFAAFAFGALDLALGTMLMAVGRIELSDLVIDMAMFVGTLALGAVVGKVGKAVGMKHLTKLAKIEDIAELERASIFVDAAVGSSEGIADEAVNGEDSGGFLSPNFSQKFRLGQESEKLISGATDSLSHFDFDPPSSFRRMAPFSIRLAGTGW